MVVDQLCYLRHARLGPDIEDILGHQRKGRERALKVLARRCAHRAEGPGQRAWRSSANRGIDEPDRVRKSFSQPFGRLFPDGRGFDINGYALSMDHPVGAQTHNQTCRRRGQTSEYDLRLVGDLTRRGCDRHATGHEWFDTLRVRVTHDQRCTHGHEALGQGPAHAAQADETNASHCHAGFLILRTSQPNSAAPGRGCQSSFQWAGIALHGVRLASARASAGTTRLPRHQPDRRGPRLRGHHWIEPARTMTAIFGAVYDIDLVIESGIDIRESNIPLDAAGLDAAFATPLGPAVPGGAVAVSRSDV